MERPGLCEFTPGPAANRVASLSAFLDIGLATRAGRHRLADKAGEYDHRQNIGQGIKCGPRQLELQNPFQHIGAQ